MMTDFENIKNILEKNAYKIEIWNNNQFISGDMIECTSLSNDIVFFKFDKKGKLIDIV